MEYNTTRNSLVIPEYGRNIHKMIAYAISVDDREERNHVARSIVKVMGQVKPQFKEADDFIQSLWDHMIIISDFKLDVDFIMNHDFVAYRERIGVVFCERKTKA